ncbi:MAG: hypothetical protein GY800_11080 [Planctomycetes bacterium]|nr:hypothetical protein [Planctomycetota bacterium]
MSRDTSVGRPVFSYLTKTLLSSALMIVVLSAGISQGQAAVSPVLAEKVKALGAIRGMCYSPKPSDAKPGGQPQRYFDSDFTNSDFPGLWNTTGGDGGFGRGDLKNLRDDLNINFLHLYDWSKPPAPGHPVGQYQRNHLPFLNKCKELGIKVMVPISNWFLKELQKNNPPGWEGINAMVAEIYQNGKKPHWAAGMWCIGNEYMASGIDAKTVAAAAEVIIRKEEALGITNPADQLPITAPVTFGMLNSKPPAIYQIQELKKAFHANPFLWGKNVWEERFIAAPQPQNDGPFLSNYIKITFPKYFPYLPYFFSELAANINDGGGTEEGQAKWVAGQLEAAGKPIGFFYGSCVFQFENQMTKQGPEAKFGIQKFAGPPTHHGTIPQGYVPGGGDKYPIDKFVEKPSYTSVRNAWKP